MLKIQKYSQYLKERHYLMYFQPLTETHECIKRRYYLKLCAVKFGFSKILFVNAIFIFVGFIRDDHLWDHHNLQKTRTIHFQNLKSWMNHCYALMNMKMMMLIQINLVAVSHSVGVYMESFNKTWIESIVGGVLIFNDAVSWKSLFEINSSIS